MEREPFALVDVPPSIGDWTNYKITVDGKAARLVFPCLITWSGSLAQPEEVESRSTGEMEKKWSLGFAIPKIATQLLGDLEKAQIDCAAAAGVKGAAFPRAFRDGDAADQFGALPKNGMVQGFYIGNAKTKKAPEVLERGSSGIIDCEPSAVAAGGFAVISCNLTMVDWGRAAGGPSKLGGSLWLSRVLWLGGGRQIVRSAASAVDDFGGYVSGRAAAPRPVAAQVDDLM